MGDAFSRVPRDETISVGKERDPQRPTSSLEDVIEDEFLLDCYLNYPTMEVMDYPLDYAVIQRHQFEDQALNDKARLEPHRFQAKEMRPGLALLCVLSRPHDPPENWKIALPTVLVDPVIHWYHLVLGHAGIRKMKDSISNHFYHPDLSARIEKYNCDACQRNKVLGPGYGELPPRDAPLMPWDEVALDLIGPWKMDVDGQEVEFHALTCIDPVTNIVELIRISNGSAAHVAQKFEQSWLARYPRPNRCIHDNGGEFTGEAFQRLLQRCGIKDVPTTSYNPQANAVCERMHQTVANILRTTLRTNPPHGIQAAEQLVDDALATAMHAMRCAVTRTLGTSPGALIFQRDMILDVPLHADLLTIQGKRQRLIDENLRRQNLKRRHYDFAVGDYVMIKQDKFSKMDERVKGPFRIVRVHVNGNVTIQRTQHITERLNIRRIVPYRSRGG